MKIRAADEYGDKQETREAIKLINMDLNKHSEAIMKAQTLQMYVNYLKSRPRDGKNLQVPPIRTIIILKKLCLTWHPACCEISYVF